MKKSTFSAAAAIARQDAQIARGLRHFDEQRQRVESGDLRGYWQAEYDFHYAGQRYVSRMLETRCAAILKTIEALSERA